MICEICRTATDSNIPGADVWFCLRCLSSFITKKHGHRGKQMYETAHGVTVTEWLLPTEVSDSVTCGHPQHNCPNFDVPLAHLSKEDLHEQAQKCLDLFEQNENTHGFLLILDDEEHDRYGIFCYHEQVFPPVGSELVGVQEIYPTS